MRIHCTTHVLYIIRVVILLIIINIINRHEICNRKTMPASNSYLINLCNVYEFFSSLTCFENYVYKQN